MDHKQDKPDFPSYRLRRVSKGRGYKEGPAVSLDWKEEVRSPRTPRSWNLQNRAAETGEPHRERILETHRGSPGVFSRILISTWRKTHREGLEGTSTRHSPRASKNVFLPARLESLMGHWMEDSGTSCYPWWRKVNSTPVVLDMGDFFPQGDIWQSL